MAGEYDEKFDQIAAILSKHDEGFEGIKEILQKTNGSVDEMRLEFRDFRKDFGDLRSEVAGLGEKVDLTNAQLRGVVGKTFENEDKIKDIDSRVTALEPGVH